MSGVPSVTEDHVNEGFYLDNFNEEKDECDTIEIRNGFRIRTLKDISLEHENRINLRKGEYIVATTTESIVQSDDSCSINQKTSLIDNNCSSEEKTEFCSLNKAKTLPNQMENDKQTIENTEAKEAVNVEGIEVSLVKQSHINNNTNSSSAKQAENGNKSQQDNSMDYVNNGTNDSSAKCPETICPTISESDDQLQTQDVVDSPSEINNHPNHNAANSVEINSEDFEEIALEDKECKTEINQESDNELKCYGIFCCDAGKLLKRLFCCKSSEN